MMKTVLLAKWYVGLTAIFTLLISLAIFHAVASDKDNLLKKYENKYAIQEFDEQPDARNIASLNKLHRDGHIIPINSIIEHQNSLYGTIITLLLSIIALMSVFIYFIIKRSSEAAAIEETRKSTEIYLERYLQTSSFSSVIDDSLMRNLGYLRDDIDDISAKIESHDESINKINLHIEVISQAVSLNSEPVNEGEIEIASEAK
ncbi:hypothetical protein [Rheinheimera soli]|uniref:hypothetical protein n=1 Tax=Rheinheimera soli TaxID=443616 RepID=UPI001E3B7183|nr:hypothetical protein [Rheinheimera soli]